MTLAPASNRLQSDSFRQIMATLAAGVAVVTALDEERIPRGLTTTAVTSVSAEPPLLLVCVAHDSRTLPAIRHSGCFVVNLIDAGASDVAVRFASKAHHKFDGLEWSAGLDGAPVLHVDAHAWAECRVEREFEAGDHVVFIGRVERGSAGGDDASPLTYYRRRFGTWASAEPNEGGDPR